MSSPSVRTYHNPTRLASTSSFGIVFPSPIVAGDLLILVIWTNTANRTMSSIPSGSGWTQIKNETATASYFVYYKFAAGTEGGATETPFTMSGLTNPCYVIYVIAGAKPSTAPEVVNAVYATTSSPDPPSITPSWGTVDTMWLAWTGRYNGTVTFNALPTDYQFPCYQNTASPSVCICEKLSTGSSENPGAFTLSASVATYSGVIAVRGITNVVVDNTAFFGGAF